MKKASPISLALLLILTVQAVGDWWYWPPTDGATVIPQNPTSSDVVAITLSGAWPNSCIPDDSAISVIGNEIYFDVIWTYSPSWCLTVITPWELTESVGPLPLGTYTVYVRPVGYPSIPETYTPMTEFTVMPTIYYVDCVDGNDNNNGLSPETAFATIQKGINTALDGDTVIVQPGLYVENINFCGKNIILRSTEPTTPSVISSTIIDGDFVGSVVRFSGSETESCVLSGFTITNGMASGGVGGGIYCPAGSSPTVTNCTIAGSWATGSGGGIGGAGSPTITNCIITGNEAVWDTGGGISLWCGSATIVNCTISGNLAYRGGGGIHSCNSSPTITNCTINANTAYKGAGIFCEGSGNPTIANCTIAGNSAEWSGGGIYWAYSNPTLTNCTFVGNSAPNGSAIACGPCGSPPCMLQLTNCILWDGSHEIWNNYGSALTITYSDIQGGWPGLGNINADPCFADPCNGDYHLQSAAGRWDPDANQWVIDANTSRCIDAGNPGCSPGDEPEPNGNRINMGVYGGTAKASKSPPNWALLADLTNDHIVDFNDLQVFVSYWPDTGQYIPSDLDRSQTVDFADFGIFAQQWFKNNYILLEIYSDGWGNLLDTITVEKEGYISFFIEEENPYYDPPQYYAYAFREGYYTELYKFTGISFPWGIWCELTVDLDPTVAGKFNGAIFMTSWFFSDDYLANTYVNLLDVDMLTFITQFQTDEQGRFAIDPLTPGPYYFEFEVFGDEPEYHLEAVSIAEEYQDFFFPCHVQAFKPNIYLYPEETIELDIDIVFPHGGQVTTAIPDYNDGWHITVEPSGIIDGQFECLFYESLQPDYGQYEAGWVVAQEQLESFFRNNLAQTGFSQEEIDDFIEYWIPRLAEYPYYAIYPQYNDELEEMIQLEFSTQPQSLIRLIYSIRGLEDDTLNMQEPVIPSFVREGLTVTEWGVILK